MVCLVNHLKIQCVHVSEGGRGVGVVLSFCVAFFGDLEFILYSKESYLI